MIVWVAPPFPEAWSPFLSNVDRGMNNSAVGAVLATSLASLYVIGTLWYDENHISITRYWQMSLCGPGCEALGRRVCSCLPQHYLAPGTQTACILYWWSKGING